MMLVVSPIYIALGALLLLGLTARVIRTRQATQIGLGDGGNPLLSRHMRMHANAVETLPMQLLMLLALELCAAPAWTLHGFGAAIVLARALHAWGMSRSSGVSMGRFVGTIISLAAFLLMPLALLWKVLVQS